MWTRDRIFELNFKKKTKDLILGKINSKGMSQGGARKKTWQKQVSVVLTIGNSGQLRQRAIRTPSKINQLSQQAELMEEGLRKTLQV